MSDQYNKSTYYNYWINNDLIKKYKRPVENMNWNFTKKLTKKKKEKGKGGKVTWSIE